MDAGRQGNKFLTERRGLGVSTDDGNNGGELQLWRDPNGRGGVCEERGTMRSGIMERGGSRVYIGAERGARGCGYALSEHKAGGYCGR